MICFGSRAILIGSRGTLMESRYERMVVREKPKAVIQIDFRISPFPRKGNRIKKAPLAPNPKKAMLTTMKAK